MITKKMVAGDFVAEFRLSPDSDPPIYRFTIRHGASGRVMTQSQEASVQDAMRKALEELERFNSRMAS